MHLRHVFSVSLLSVLSACAVVDLESGGQSSVNMNEREDKPSHQSVAESEKTIWRVSDFEAQPLSQLEEHLGEPDFIRTEGLGEFRRYDTDNCRIYAIVSTDASEARRIKSLSVNSPILDEPAPALSACF